MIKRDKLKKNLEQSQQWGSTFKAQIKALMEEITLKNQQIIQFAKDNPALRSQIQKNRVQLKTYTDDRLKIGYRIDKKQIQLEELGNRCKVYEEIYKKKFAWNEELTNKMMLLEVDLQRQRHSLEEDDDIYCESSREKGAEKSQSGSVASHVSFKEDSIKKVLSKPRMQLDQQLKQLKCLEEEFRRQKDRCRELESQLQIAERKEKRIKEDLLDGQENIPSGSNKENSLPNKSAKEQKNYENAIKGTTNAAKTLRQLQQKNENLNNQLSQMYKKINGLSVVLNQLVQCDSSVQPLHKEIANLQRQVKRQKSTMHTIKTYMHSAKV